MDVTVGKKSNDKLKLAYIAGFLDGDGAISAVIEKHPEKKYKFRIRVAMDFYQHQDNAKVLEYIKDFFEEGSVGKSIRNTMKLSLRNQETLRALLPLIGKYTVIKKNQIEIALRILNSSIVTKRDLIKIAKLADKLSSYNVRSKSRRKNYSKIIV